MVSDRRGQLLLIGAVAVGIVIIGTVVFLQGVLYSSTAETQGNDRTVEDVTTGTHAIAEDIRTMMDQIQRSGPANYSAALQENISVYSRHYGNMSASDGPAYVNVSINTSRSVGDRFINSSTTTFERPDGVNQASGWSLIDEETDILRFKMSFDEVVNGTQSNAFMINVDAGSSWEFRIYNHTENQSWIIQTRSGGSPWENRCNIGSPSPPVELDMAAGEGPGSCQFPTFAKIDAPYTKLTFKNEAKARGTYQVSAGKLDESKFPNNGEWDDSAVVYPAIRVVYEGPQVSIGTTTHVNGTEVGS
jgi:hypothetical protein